MTATKKRSKKKRKYKLTCLKCDKEFMSKSKIYNRICTNCSEANKNVSSVHDKYEEHL